MKYKIYYYDRCQGEWIGSHEFMTRAEAVAAAQNLWGAPEWRVERMD
jgi:hypothetical protein